MNNTKKKEFFTESELIELEKVSQYLNTNSIAFHFGISASTFLRIRKRQADAMTAYRRGRAKADLYVSNLLFDKIKSGDMSAISMYQKFMARWTDKERTMMEEVGELDFSTEEARQESCNKIAQAIVTHENIEIDDMIKVLQIMLNPRNFEGLTAVPNAILEKFNDEEKERLDALLTDHHNRVLQETK